MSPIKTLAVGALIASGFALSACTEDGYGGGVAVGYSDWDPYYGGFRADPYWGWYGDYYYPGTGYYVWDRRGYRHRWSDRHRRYWEGRRGHYRDRRDNWNDYRYQRRDYRRDYRGRDDHRRG